jgi:hypothetical protein
MKPVDSFLDNAAKRVKIRLTPQSRLEIYYSTGFLLASDAGVRTKAMQAMRVAI